ncbi:magnesium protoporphyrin IX methyltransferase [Forsythia ovata]|uniref:Magnesium protoporphyrin IX methyltransferase n=1 Tax=Forsythia ovata TaxID=205694 RepID=A0ABD1RKD9_9LAMI
MVLPPVGEIEIEKTYIMAFTSSLFYPMQLFPNPILPKLYCWKTPGVAAAISPFSTATDIFVVENPFDSTTLAVIGRSSVVALATMLSLADLERRRKMQAEEVGGRDISG